MGRHALKKNLDVATFAHVDVATFAHVDVATFAHFHCRKDNFFKKKIFMHGLFTWNATANSLKAINQAASVCIHKQHMCVAKMHKQASLELPKSRMSLMQCPQAWHSGLQMR